MPNPTTDLTFLLRREIEAQGPISFARFMEVALSHPAHGYYQQPLKQIGCQGDFYTSVSVGPLFGQLLGFRFAAWLDRLSSVQPPQTGEASSPAPLQIVEAGAHDGRLALDILSWIEQHRPELLPKLEYWILEPFPVRRASQTSRLANFNQHLRWFNDWTEVEANTIRGLIFANELLDALPVFRLAWDSSRRRWTEWRVGVHGSDFNWVRWDQLGPEVASELNASFLGNLPRNLTEVLPDGFTVEICPAARDWWSQAAGRLQDGKLLTFDYGLAWEEILMPHRGEGTLRSYRSHRAALDPLARPGEQDLTAHINFSDIIQAGERAGLTTECFCPQSLFLTKIMEEAFQDLSRFGAWTRATTRQFQTLTHPNHLGRAFRVLQQNRTAGG